ncbi:MAG: aminodeoxychorismate lyase [Candidatus Parcubacteria bacterium]|nr:MAG: aminodeoxychorismate lyase [Candidatus Parcubacteria bacterium]
MVYENLIQKIFKLYPWLVFLTFLTFIIFHFLYSIFSPVFIGEIKEIVIQPGEKIKTLAWKLEQEKIIRSSFYFRLLIAFKKSKIKAGIYKFNGFYTLNDVIKELEKGGRGIKITISEGMTAKEIENLLIKNGFKVNLSKYRLRDFEDINLTKYFPSSSSLEGFLAPDTYEFFPSDDEKTIVREILLNFYKKILPEILKGIDFSPYERLILASIVEKEAKNKDDFPVIADVLIKRLKSGNKLEADAVLVYEKCNFIFCSDPLTKKDLLTPSPFNVYLNKGLPPQPISNPGILAIKSVNEPTKTDYWFYLTTKTGQAVFSKNFNEHKKNIEKYLK